MNKVTQISGKGIMVAALAAVFFSVPLNSARADEQADRAAYQRKMDEQIQYLDNKIEDVQQNYKEQGDKADLKIKEYQDRIAEIKRKSSENMDEKDVSVWDREKKSLEDRIQNVRKDFYDWRLTKIIEGNNKKIEELKMKAKIGDDADKKLQLEEKVKKTEVRNQAAQAKLNDLKATNGENWDRIEAELDVWLIDIDKEYKEAKVELNKK